MNSLVGSVTVGCPSCAEGNVVKKSLPVRGVYLLRVWGSGERNAVKINKCDNFRSGCAAEKTRHDTHRGVSLK